VQVKNDNFLQKQNKHKAKTHKGKKTTMNKNKTTTKPEHVEDHGERETLDNDPT